MSLPPKAERALSALRQEEDFLRQLKEAFETQLMRLKLEEATLLKCIKELTKDEKASVEALGDINFAKDQQTARLGLEEDLKVNAIPLAGLQSSRDNDVDITQVWQDPKGNSIEAGKDIFLQGHEKMPKLKYQMEQDEGEEEEEEEEEEDEEEEEEEKSDDAK